jgi:hypothetical protein
MGKCAAGNELPMRGSCPKCGATSSEPCPEALRIAREEREILIRALAFFADGNNWMREAECDPNSSNFRGVQVALDALAAVGTGKQP